MRRLIEKTLVAVMCLLASHTSGQEITPDRPDGDVSFQALTRTAGSPGAQPELRGWKLIADPADWPASVYATLRTKSGHMGSCTASFVGGNVLLTAGHCVPVSSKIAVMLANGDSRTAVCEVHPDYASGRDLSADFALCRVDGESVAPQVKTFETIETSGFEEGSGTQVILTGFGCVSDDLQTSLSANGTIRDAHGKPLYLIGLGWIAETSRSVKRRYEKRIYTGKEENNWITRDDPADANLCPGDSGGPAFRRTDGSADRYTSRRIVGVNSRVMYRDGPKVKLGASLISATSGPAFARWAREWQQKHGVPICGVTGTLDQNCRS